MAVRQRRQTEQWPVDVACLTWLARFRFCSADLLEARFGISARKCRKRLSRLETTGLVISSQSHRAAPKLYAIGPRGRRLLGLEQRRPPRWDVQVVHELSIVRLAAQFEMGRPDARVLSERDCRRAEARGAGQFSVVCQNQSGMTRRWPDLVIEESGRRLAVEVELAPKTTARLRTILLGYLTARAYDEVRYLCASSALERRISRLVEQLGGGAIVTVGPA